MAIQYDSMDGIVDQRSIGSPTILAVLANSKSCLTSFPLTNPRLPSVFLTVKKKLWFFFNFKGSVLNIMDQYFCQKLRLGFSTVETFWLFEMSFF